MDPYVIDLFSMKHEAVSFCPHTLQRRSPRILASADVGAQADPILLDRSMLSADVYMPVVRIGVATGSLPALVDHGAMPHTIRFR